MTLRKIGGMYWLAIGRYRIAFCITRSKPLRKLPIAKWDPPIRPHRLNPPQQYKHELANFGIRAKWNQ